MTSEQFTYWLQGFMEVSDPIKLNKKQIKVIKDHLSLVFTKVTPDRSEESPEDYPKCFEDLTPPHRPYISPPPVVCSDNGVPLFCKSVSSNTTEFPIGTNTTEKLTDKTNTENYVRIL